MSYEGSMKGSGIYGYHTTVCLICDAELYDADDNVIGTCDFDDDVDAYVNDWGTISATCPKCNYEHDDLGNVRDE